MKKDCFGLKFGGFNKCLGCARELACKRQYELLIEGYQVGALEDLEIVNER